VVVARAVRAVGRTTALAGLLGAGLLLLGPVQARAVEPAAPPTATPRKESPYARYAREHAKTVEKKPNRMKLTPTGGRNPRVNTRGGQR
jgi:hypothetical protein